MTDGVEASKRREGGGSGGSFLIRALWTSDSQLDWLGVGNAGD